ncbi:NAD(+) synthase [Psychromonas sp. SP041]|uniref:NAD(+) synthase n=1 Tax=Psychromonas sp. SP041 TaxID=1365007 RepID=UPI001484E51E|nr:NAD(+) synthase [Psychromonas sp. SP041]
MSLKRNKIRVAAISANLTPRDWDGNVDKINKGIADAVSKGASIIVTPELSITGYGNEDMFFFSDTEDMVFKSLENLKIPKSVSVVVGFPLVVANRMYNASAFIANKYGNLEIQGIYLKQNLAKNGVHYEPRWFNKWTKGESIVMEIMGSKVPVGDVTFDFDGVIIGNEVCEDSWVASRPGVDLFSKGVDLIINPSASHFAVGKYKIREQLICEGSRAFGAAYIYANINGCESGRTVYDGGNIIASNGKIVARGRRLFFDDIDVSVADIDLWENRLVHQASSQSILTHATSNHIKIGFDLTEQVLPPIEYRQQSRWELSENLEHEETVRAVALGMYDWLKKTGVKGYMLSLSGGADSALCAAEILIIIENVFNDFNVNCFTDLPCWMKSIYPELEALKLPSPELKKAVAQKMLWCVYQGTENSSDTTFDAAENLANSIGAHFGAWNINQEILGYTQKVESYIGRKLTWETDDITLQNIQARVRVPGLWMVANATSRLLMTTSNMSESAVGYQTMDGDSAGCLAPIIGIRKSKVLEILEWLYVQGTAIGDNTITIPGLDLVINQKPTAELRPTEQNDEDDLMPFYILDLIISETIVSRRGPSDLFLSLREKTNEYTDLELVNFIVRYFELFSRNQWKRDRSAPGFHIEQDSLDPKTYARFPLLNSGMKKELNDLKRSVGII